MPVYLQSGSLTLILFLQLLAMKRVGVLHGGMPHGSEEKAIPPSQRLRITRYSETGSPYASSALSQTEDEGGLMG